MVNKMAWLILLMTLLPTLGLCEKPIKEIRIVGNVKIEKEVILRTIKSKENEPFDKEVVSDDVKALYALGYFRDIRVHLEEKEDGVILTYIVQEKPKVKDLIISGYQRLKREEIEGVSRIKKGEFFEEELLRETEEALKNLYASKGFYTASIESEVEELPDNEVRVFIDIYEGPKGAIREIRFVGNRSFSSRTLKKLMQTKEKDWLSWLTKSGTFNKEILQVDLQRIRYFYQDNGYLDVKIDEPKINSSRDGKYLFIEIKIEEGIPYKVGTVDLQGELIETKEKILKKVKLETKPNKVYRISQVERDVSKLVDYYADKGYAFVEVRPLSFREPEKGLVKVVFQVEPGEKVYLGRVHIHGNTKTHDKVIRREIKLSEGETYSAVKMRESQKRIKRLGIFKEVTFNPVPGARPNVLDLDVKVEEMPTGAFQFGGGYSSVHGLVGMISVSEKNLFGRAYRGYLKATLGGKMNEFSLGFSDPRFLDSSYSIGFDLFNETYKYTTYDYRIRGGDVVIGKELTDHLSVSLSYRYERQKVFNVSEDASEYIKSYEGVSTTSKATLSFSYWTLDDPFSPTLGWDNDFTLTNAGRFLGGDVDFLRASLSISYFKPIKGDLVFNFRSKLGIIEEYGGKKIPLGEKFYVGGLRTIRGFEYGMAGPVDENKEPIGALKMVVFNFEFLYPLSKELGLKLALFYDVGKGFDEWKDITPLKHAVGAGIRWYSPLGPIRIDWGYNLFPKKGEKRGVWDFAVGIMY